MDNETAKRMVKEGATLVCLNMPFRSGFGIDVANFEVDRKFRGMKMIPPGLHFVWTMSLPSKPVESHDSDDEDDPKGLADLTIDMSDGRLLETIDEDHNNEEEHLSDDEVKVEEKDDDHSTLSKSPFSPISEDEIEEADVPIAKDPTQRRKRRKDFDSEEELSVPLRMGFWINLKHSEIRVFEWSKAHRCLIPMESHDCNLLRCSVKRDSSEEEQRTELRSIIQDECEQNARITEAVMKTELDRYLGPYPLRIYDQWNDQLIDHTYMNDEFTQQMCPVNVEGYSYSVMNKYEWGKWKLRYYQAYHYTHIPSVSEWISIRKSSKIVSSSSDPRELSLLCMDKTPIFRSLEFSFNSGSSSSSSASSASLLSELRFCFVSFWLGNHLQSLEQWKMIIDLLCHCFSLFSDDQSFYQRFISILIVQLSHLPRDFFTDSLTKHNFLNRSLLNLFDMSNEIEVRSTMTPELYRTLQSLRSLCQSQFKLKFDLFDYSEKIMAFE